MAEIEEQILGDDDKQALTPVATLMKMIITALVDHPDNVEIREFSGQLSTVIEVESAASDLGKLVGRHGRTADALRTLLVGFGGKASRRFILELIEPTNHDRGRFGGGRRPSGD